MAASGSAAVQGAEQLFEASLNLGSLVACCTFLLDRPLGPRNIEMRSEGTGIVFDFRLV
ncbi:MAG: hypothetical protein NVS3B12_07450 [Acidimicrobiales bacterium]